MELSLQTFLIVCPLVFLAGFVDAIGGGGGLISLPAYYLAGVPMHFALGSNKFSSTIGTIVSTARYWKNRYMDISVVLPAIVVTFLGSVLGANLALIAPEKILQYMLIIILPITAFVVLKNKNFSTQKQVSRRFQVITSVIAAFFIGTYDGFYGPGTGTFLIICFTMISGLDIKTASGNAKMINLTSNIAALVTFLLNGKVMIPLAACASIFSILGHYLGSGMVLKNGTKVVRPIILCVLVILLIRVISELIM